MKTLSYIYAISTFLGNFINFATLALAGSRISVFVLLYKYTEQLVDQLRGLTAYLDS